jgi:hypothetical protein
MPSVANVVIAAWKERKAMIVDESRSGFWDMRV